MTTETQQTEQTEAQPKPAPRADPAKLIQWARDTVDGKIFGSWMMRPEEIKHHGQMIFMPLFFAGKNAIPTNLAHAFEYYSEAGPRSVNGLPIFFSCHCIVQEDIRQFAFLIHRFQREKQLAELRASIALIPERHKRWLAWLGFYNGRIAAHVVNLLAKFKRKEKPADGNREQRAADEGTDNA